MAVELASGECFSLNESGATFLEALRAAPPPSAPDLNALAQALNRPADEVTRDMEAFITRLCALGLAERVME